MIHGPFRPRCLPSLKIVPIPQMELLVLQQRFDLAPVDDNPRMDGAARRRDSPCFEKHFVWMTDQTTNPCMPRSTKSAISRSRKKKKKMLGICEFGLDPAQHANKLPASISIYTHQHLPIWPFIVLIHNSFHLYVQGDASSETSTEMSRSTKERKASSAEMVSSGAAY